MTEDNNILRGARWLGGHIRRFVLIRKSAKVVCDTVDTVSWLWKRARSDDHPRIRTCVSLVCIGFIALAAFCIVPMLPWHDDNGETVRNWVLTLAPFGAAYFWWGRNAALQRQAQNSEDRLQHDQKEAERQAKHERERLAGEQFVTAAKLLAQKDQSGEPTISARIGGVYALQSLADNCVRDKLPRYTRQAIRTLISYIKDNAQRTAYQRKYDKKEVEKHKILGEDVKAAFASLKQLLDEHGKSLRKDDASFEKDLNFSGQDFSNIDLSYSEVDGLKHYNWRQADLRGVNLRHANLQGVTLWDANLQGANLSNADLQGAHLSDADLQGAHLWGVNFQGADLLGADLQGANLPPALQGVCLSNARLQKANLVHVNLQGARLCYVNLQGADLRDADLQGVNLQSADLQGADLQGANLQSADLRDVKVSVKTKFPSELDRKIWHSRNCSQLKKVEPRAYDADWDLSVFDTSPALVGVLYNFVILGLSKQGEADEGKRAHALCKAACKLLDEDKLPEGFPRNWRNWLDRRRRETYEEPSS